MWAMYSQGIQQTPAGCVTPQNESAMKSTTLVYPIAFPRCRPLFPHSFAAQIDMVYALGLIQPELRHDLNQIGKVRKAACENG